MCIRDRDRDDQFGKRLASRPRSPLDYSQAHGRAPGQCTDCLLYTSDAADERSSVDLGGRRILKKKNKEKPVGVVTPSHKIRN